MVGVDELFVRAIKNLRGYTQHLPKVKLILPAYEAKQLEIDFTPTVVGTEESEFQFSFGGSENIRIGDTTFDSVADIHVLCQEKHTSGGNSVQMYTESVGETRDKELEVKEGSKKKNPRKVLKAEETILSNYKHKTDMENLVRHLSLPPPPMLIYSSPR